MLGFTVNVDGEFATTDAVVPTACEQTILEGNYNPNIDLLIGSNTEEGLLITYPAYLDPRYILSFFSLYKISLKNSTKHIVGIEVIIMQNIL